MITISCDSATNDCTATTDREHPAPGWVSTWQLGGRLLIRRCPAHAGEITPFTPVPGMRVHVLGVRTGTVLQAADPRGYVRVSVDALPSANLEAIDCWSVRADVLRPVRT